MNIIYAVMNWKLWHCTNLKSQCVASDAAYCYTCRVVCLSVCWSQVHKSCKKPKRLRCAVSRPRWCIKGPVRFLKPGSTTERYMLLLGLVWCTALMIDRLFSSPNCTKESVWRCAVCRTAPITMHITATTKQYSRDTDNYWTFPTSTVLWYQKVWHFIN